jgi:hypothetical protein
MHLSAAAARHSASLQHATASSSSSNVKTASRSDSAQRLLPMQTHTQDSQEAAAVTGPFKGNWPEWTN